MSFYIFFICPFIYSLYVLLYILLMFFYIYKFIVFFSLCCISLCSSVLPFSLPSLCQLYLVLSTVLHLTTQLCATFLPLLTMLLLSCSFHCVASNYGALRYLSLSSDYVDFTVLTHRSDLIVWTTYNSLCYSMIPKTIQPLTTAVMTSCWSAYVSFVSMKGTPNSVMNKNAKGRKADGNNK